MGAWIAKDGHIRGKVVEISADRTTYRFVSRGELTFTVDVANDILSGPGTATFYDADDKLIRGPIHASLQGHRILP